jgi:hypothetical protein
MLWILIRMFLGLLDPDLLVRGKADLDPHIISTEQRSKYQIQILTDTLYWENSKLYNFLISGTISNDIRLKKCNNNFKNANNVTKNECCGSDFSHPGSRIQA